MGVGAATSGNFVGLFRPRRRRSVQSSPGIPFSPPVFHAGTLAPPCLGRSLGKWPWQGFSPEWDGLHPAGRRSRAKDATPKRFK